MTTSRRAIAAAVTAALLLAACGGDTELSIDDARSRMSPMLVGVAAVFLDVTNDTGSDDVLLSASVPATIAGRVELHETFAADDDTMGDDGAMDGEMGDDTMGDDGAMDDEMGDDTMGDDGAMDDGAMDDGAMDDGAMDGEMAGGTEPTPDGFAMMGMREVPTIDVPDGTTVSLEPGGLHVMLIELVDDLRPGDTFELTLSFDQAGERTVTVEVREQV